METISNALMVIATVLVPIASCIISFLTYRNERKKKEVENKIEQNNINGNNYYYENNKNINLVVEEKELKELSTKQQNLDDVSNFLSRHSSWLPLILYVINFLNLFLPLPNYPPLLFNSNEPDLLRFLANSLYQAFLPTAVSILLALTLLCVALTIKSIISDRSSKKFASILFYFFTAVTYFYCKNVVAMIPLDKINFSRETMQISDLSSFTDFLLPFFPVLFAVLSWWFTHNLIKVLFETKHSKPNLKLFRISIKRTFFFIGLFVLPFLIIHITTKY